MANGVGKILGPLSLALIACIGVLSRPRRPAIALGTKAR